MGNLNKYILELRQKYFGILINTILNLDKYNSQFGIWKNNCFGAVKSSYFQGEVAFLVCPKSPTLMLSEEVLHPHPSICGRKAAAPT